MEKDDILSINLLGYNERINFNDSNLGILLNLPQDIKKVLLPMFSKSTVKS